MSSVLTASSHETRAPKNDARGQKTASGFFGGNYDNRAGKNHANPTETHQLAQPSATETASDARNNRNRYYDPNTGRWPSTDPIGFKGGLNLYAYVNNNAVNLIDADGFAASEITATRTGVFLEYRGPNFPVNKITITFKKCGQAVVGKHVNESIWKNSMVSYNATSENSAPFNSWVTDGDGKIIDYWADPFTKDDGSVNVIQTLTIEDDGGYRSGTWSATHSADGTIAGDLSMQMR